MFSLLLALSPFIANVHEYCPAPGQFINSAPEYETGDTYADMLLKAEEQLCGEAAPGLVSLGAFGGYIVFSFDHPVVNVEGTGDFKIYGNAISNGSEPGIVSVSIDINGNGIPDDPWYELRGSEAKSASTVYGYRITYHRPAADHTPILDADHKFITDAQYCAWDASDGTSGWLYTTDAHDAPYWPQWLDSGCETLTFTGTRLAPNGIDRNGKGTNYDIIPYAWGYADNRPNTTMDAFDLDNAIDSEGNPVRLTHADFIRVHTAVNQMLGWLGESSTEIAGAEDLHPEVSSVDYVSAADETWRLRSVDPATLTIEAYAPTHLTLCRPDGQLLGKYSITPGLNRIPRPAGGLIICHGGNRTLKITAK